MRSETVAPKAMDGVVAAATMKYTPYSLIGVHFSKVELLQILAVQFSVEKE